MSVTEEIKSRLDIVNYVQQSVPLKKSGRYFKACCPFHNEKTPSFIVNPESQTWRCFGACAEGGDVFSFAMKQNGWSFKEALQELGAQVGVEVRKQTPQQKAEVERLDHLRGILQTATDFYHEYLLSDEAKPTLQYAIEQRGLTLDTIKTFQIGCSVDAWQEMLNALTNLGYSEDEIIEVGLAIRNDKGRVYDRFRNRLMIPIRDERGRVVGFGARVLNPEDNPKYLNSPQTPLFDKSKLLFGLDMGKSAIRDSETAVIAEGYMDVIQAHQAGFKNVVAQMGTAMTETQLGLLAPRFAKKVILALDSDDAGQQATRRSLEVAREALQKDYAGKLSVDIRVLQIQDGKDPDDFLRESPDKWQDLVNSAIPVADFVIDMETSHLESNASVQERQAVARAILPILTASENNFYKQDNIQKLALRLRINESDLLAWAGEQQQIQQAKAPRPPASPDDLPPNLPPLEEPPPELYEAGDWYPEMDTTGAPVSERSPTLAKATQSLAKVMGRDSRAVEGYCLRLLLMYPDLLYHANRKLRELAANNPDLLNGPLADLSVDDFTQSEYRQLMHYFIQAIEQDALEPIDYLREEAEAELLPDLNGLLAEETQLLQGRLQHRLKGDFSQIYEDLSRHGRVSADPQQTLVGKALQLRVQRLQREREDLRFLQMESEGGRELNDQYAQQIVLSMQAKLRIDIALQ